MRQEEFRKFLRTKGKQVHVVDQMIKLAAGFKASSGKSLNDITAKELARLLPELERNEQGLGKKTARAVGLHLAMAGKSEAAAAAWAFRKEAIARQRAPLSLKQLLNVAPDACNRSTASGIVNAEQMLAHGRTKPEQEALSRRIGISYAAILELVKLSDLSRIFGVKGVRARLYYTAGVDRPAKLAPWDLQELRAMLVEFVAKTGFPGIVPLPKEARFTVMEAKTLPEVVEYEE